MQLTGVLNRPTQCCLQLVLFQWCDDDALIFCQLKGQQEFGMCKAPARSSAISTSISRLIRRRLQFGREFFRALITGKCWNMFSNLVHLHTRFAVVSSSSAQNLHYLFFDCKLQSEYCSSAFDAACFGCLKATLFQNVI
jgi:hypothetical protein